MFMCSHTYVDTLHTLLRMILQDIIVYTVQILICIVLDSKTVLTYMHMHHVFACASINGGVTAKNVEHDQRRNTETKDLGGFPCCLCAHM